MSYEIHLSTNAKEGLTKLKRNEPRAFEKTRGMLHDRVLTVLVLSSYGHYDDK